MRKGRDRRDFRLGWAELGLIQPRDTARVAPAVHIFMANIWPQGHLGVSASLTN